MSEYSVWFGERQYQVSILKDKVLVNNQPMEADLTALNENGLHLLRRDQKILEMYLNATADDTCEVLVGSRRLIARVESGFKRNRSRGKADNAGKLVAPMPGLILSVLVNVGDAVEKGQPLVVMESMKMQMQLRSTVSGQVESIQVQPGMQVNKGTTLVVVK